MKARSIQLRAAGRTERGYSLVELILVIAIIGVLSGMALPRYGRSVARYRADAAAKRVVAELQQAQLRARAGSGACVVAFGITTATLSTTYPTINGAAGRTVETSLALAPFLAKIQSANFSGAAAITFNGFGRPSSGGTVVIQCGSEQRTITVAASNGAATIS